MVVESATFPTVKTREVVLGTTLEPGSTLWAKIFPLFSGVEAKSRRSTIKLAAVSWERTDS